MTVLACRLGDLELRGLPADLERTIKDRLTFANPKHAEAERAGRWTGRIDRELRFYSRSGATLHVPRGVGIDALCAAAGVELRTFDETTDDPAPLAFTGELRPYQQRAVASLLEHEQGTIIAPTGSGKSVMGCALLAARGCRSLIVTHTRELARQWAENVRRFLGVEPGQVGGGRKREGAEVTIAMVQTLARSKCEALEQDYGLALVDELHHAPASSWAAVLDLLPARYRNGLSATPWRRDGLEGLIPLYFGPARVEVSKAEVEEGGSIVPATVRPVYTGIRCDLDEWTAVANELANDRDRNDLIVRLALRESERAPVLVLTDRIEHAEHLAARVHGAELLHGELRKLEREAAIRRVREGARVTVATASLLGEGVDIPGWGVLILAWPMGSKSPRVLQAVGRIVRPAPGKTRALVLDLVDENPLTLAAWRGRSTLYRRNGIVVETRPAPVAPRLAEVAP